MKRFLQIIYATYMWTVVVLCTVTTATFIIVCAFILYPFDHNRQIANIGAEVWGKMIFAANPFWKLKMQGLGYLRKHKGYILVVNHLSAMDIVCLFCMGKNFKWVAKDSLFRIPFFGWAMSALGYVSLKRGEHGSIRDSYRESMKWLNRGVSVLIFPEGTRSSSGKLGTFKNGAFKLAAQTKKPIVPIVLTGTREIIQRGSSIPALRARVKLKVLKPIETTHYQEKQFVELMDLVRSKMLEHIP